MSENKAYEIVKTTWGAVSIKDNLNAGEIMHNPVGPWTEAQELYVNQSQFSERMISKDEFTHPLVVFDVGLGAGFNSLCVLRELRKLQEEAKTKGYKLRPLMIVSFELRLELFEFSKDHLAELEVSGEELEIFQDLMATLLSHGFAEGQGFSWILRHGRFQDLILNETEKPEIVFYDPYSPKTNPDMWTLDCFTALHKLSDSRHPHILMTYSVATPIRVTLLLSGYFVGNGNTSGFKTETTFAGTRKEDVLNILGDRWFERWTRSDTPLPLGQPLYSREDVLKRLEGHPQFAYRARFKSLKTTNF